MRVASLLALLPLLSGVFASDVLDLNKDNFQTEVFDADLALVEFFAPWCGHCKNLAPEYEEAATILKKTGVKLAKVDCTVEAEVCQTYEVSGYPTLKVFRNGVPTDYTGPRKADGIVSYMNKQSLPAVTELTTETHDDFTKADKVVVIAYGDDKHPVPKAFAEYANANRDSFVFGTFEGADVPELPGKASLPAIVLYKDFDEEGSVVFPGSSKDVTAEQLGEFVKVQSVPIFDQLGPENFATYAEAGIPIAYLFIDPSDENRETIIGGLKKTTEELRGQVNFVWIDGVKFVEYGKQLGLHADALPGFVLHNIESTQKWVLPEDVSSASIGKFVTGALKGDVKPTVKSQAVPESQDEPVWKLTTNGWDELIGDETKDVFAEFYAPWCGHCQRLAPTWDTLGEKYKSSNVVIAQMDATENDIPAEAPFKVSGFPTLKFRPAGTTEWVDYQGDRSYESLVEFIEANRKSPAVEARDVPEDEESEEKEEAAAHDEL